MKTCIRCHIEYPLSEYRKHPGFKNGIHSACKTCLKMEGKLYYATHKEKWVESEKRKKDRDPEGYKQRSKEAQERYRANPENTIRLRYLKARYGLTIEQYVTLEQIQEGLCAICKSPPTGKVRSGKPATRLHVDHDHITGKVRGLLCFDCNVMLGKAKDSIDILTKAAQYLHSFVPLKS